MFMHIREDSNMYSVADLHEWFYQDGPDLRWRKSPSRTVAAGAVAGSPDKDGYLRVRFKGKYYRAHHLAFTLHHGRPPATPLLDHKDHNVTNNAPDNLREADHTDNGHNRIVGSNSASGIKGVYYLKRLGRWEGRVCHRGKVYTKSSREQAVCVEFVRVKRAELAGEFAHD